ncbi:MAG: response regulator [Acidobacteria bacterium]|nr:response regulator [Acidobacteriota bacterium]
MMGRLLETNGYSCQTAANGRDARAHLEEEFFEVVLCDLNMPGESGLQLADFIAGAYPQTATLMVTACTDPGLAELALDRGVLGCLAKPFDNNELLLNVANVLRRRELELASKAKEEFLQHAIHERTQALHTALRELESAEVQGQPCQEEAIHRLARVAESRDFETVEHVLRVSHYCGLLARKLQLPESQCELIRLASPLHDLGKIGIPDYILLKPGRLSAEETRTVRRHAEIGYGILTDFQGELMQLAAKIAWTHHEKVDGTGYPRGLCGEDIPVEGRIAAIADVFDAITNKRTYKPAYSIDEAVELMVKGRATHFDVPLLDLFLDAMEDVLRIMKLFPNHSRHQP